MPRILPRSPQQTQAYLIGSGIASLAAAVHLIQDAGVPPANIHVLESGPLPGGSMDAAGGPKDGYVMRGGRMLNFSYICLYELLAKVPSLTNAKKSVLVEIQEFNALDANKTSAHARLVASTSYGPQIVDVKSMGLSNRDRLDLIKINVEGEKAMGRKRIDECFQNDFFSTNFWYMWASMFAFQPWHSAAEFRRYLHRFIREFPRINTLSGVDRTPYNQYDSIIAPIVAYLTAKGVDFRYSTKVLDIDFIQGIPLTASEIHMTQNGIPMTVNMDPEDVVFVTLGSMTAGAAIGTNTEPPPTVSPEATQDGSWDLWNKLAAKDESSFGNPTNFTQRVPESTWESFTVTLQDPQRTFLKRLIAFSHNEPGTGALVTFKHSPWLMSIVIPHQPHFIKQPESVQVFWGYGLIPHHEGSKVKKPMKDCSGAEILTELLYLLAFPEAETATILSTSITRPCLMPYITAQFLTREPCAYNEPRNFTLPNQQIKNGAKHGDRPLVIPERSTNIALLGQFVEIPDDVVFTVEYSVRGAQMAVYQLFGVEKSVKPPVQGERNMVVLGEIVQKFLS